MERPRSNPGPLPLRERAANAYAATLKLKVLSVMYRLPL
jgi:hypothetical protein